MQELGEVQPHQSDTQDGLRILARIIARGVAAGRPAKIDGLPSDLASTKVTPVDLDNNLKGNAQR